MTDAAHDQDATGVSAAGAEKPGDESLRAWTEASAQPTWTSIDAEGEGASGAADRARRPSSLLRDAHVPPRASALGHSIGEKIAFVTNHGDNGNGDVQIDPGAGAEFGASIPADALPREPRFQELTERVRVLAADRPEVVIGIAFAGGLVLATILKRLGR